MTSNRILFGKNYKLMRHYLFAMSNKVNTNHYYPNGQTSLRWGEINFASPTTDLVENATILDYDFTVDSLQEPSAMFGPNTSLAIVRILRHPKYVINTNTYVLGNYPNQDLLCNYILDTNKQEFTSGVIPQERWLPGHHKDEIELHGMKAIEGFAVKALDGLLPNVNIPFVLDVKFYQ